MERKKMLITNIKFADYNPRIMKQQEMEKLKRSIETFGCYEPLIVNRQTGNVVGGNQRLRALIELGHKEAEIVSVDLPLKKEKLLNIALNKIQGEFLEDQLATLLVELNEMPDIDTTLTGFDLPEISEILDRSVEDKEDDFNFDEAVKDIEEPVTKLGDLIELGAHRIMCADASVSENYDCLFKNEHAHLFWTDLPYRVNYSASRPGAPANGRWKKIKGDDLSQEEYDVLMRDILKNTAMFIKDGGPVYIWNGHRQFWTMSQMLVELGFHPACVITWAKPGFSPSYADYQQQTEFCLYGWKKGASHPWYGSAESSLWEVNRDPANRLIHPTQKPVALAQRAIRNSSQRGEIVFDGCLGSASVLISAESLGRRCFGFEIDPAYCDGIVRRYIAYVGIDNVSKEIRKKYAEVVNETS